MLTEKLPGSLPDSESNSCTTMPHVSFEMTYNHKLESKTFSRSTDLAFMFGFQSICSQGSMAPPHCVMKQIKNSSILHTRQRGTERVSHLAEVTEHVRERKGLALHQLTLRITLTKTSFLKCHPLVFSPNQLDTLFHMRRFYRD